MSLTIDLSEEQIAVLAAKARTTGISVEQYVSQLLERHLAPDSLQASWSNSKDADCDGISMEEIDAEIVAVRKSRYNYLEL